MSGGYKFLRGLVRWWLALSSRRIRVLGAEKLPTARAVLLVVSHPASFLDALILVAAFDRPVSCLLTSNLLQGFWAGWLARHLGMIRYEPGEGFGSPPAVGAKGSQGPARQVLLEKGQGSLPMPEAARATPGRTAVGPWAPPKPAWEACCDVLASQGVVAVFADPQGAREPAAARQGAAETLEPAATLALAAESRQGGRLELVLLPLALYVPSERSPSRELLLYLDSPLAPLGPKPQGGDLRAQTRVLASLLEQRFRENPFRLQPDDLKVFITEMEEVLRANLEEDWASRPNWKQKVDEFQLSGFVSEWTAQVNTLEPARLVGLRESLDTWREARRRLALWQSEVEAAGAGMNSPLRRAAVWAESALGGLLAIYGLINHLPALLILYAAGLLKSDPERDPRKDWLIGGAVLVACYTAQVLLLGHWMGRAAAGYYAPTLPVTGVYLWRYFWLFRHRTRPAILGLLLPARDRKLRRMRQEFVAEFNRALNDYAELPEATKV